jgi:hypothetical protein
VQEFKRITKWGGAQVLYFGDHIFNDLSEPSSAEGWKTGVIIRELEREVIIQNSPGLLNVITAVITLHFRIQISVGRIVGGNKSLLR